MPRARSIRVLHVGSPTGLYGAERWILALVKHLPAHVESTVSVIKDAPHYQAELCREAQRLGAKSHVFESYGRLSLASISQVRRYIVRERIDVIHTHGYKSDLIGCLSVKGIGCHIVSTPHGWSTNAGWRLKAYESLNRCAFPFMDAVVPLSADLHSDLQRLPGMRSNLFLIRNAVDLSEVESAPEAAPDLHSYKRAGEFLIGYIGQLIPRKDIETLIRALAQLKSINARVCVIGEGAQRQQLEELAAELGVDQRVTFFGYRADRLSLLKGFDAFVLPSRLEGIPRCVLEAMAANVPVVATDIPGCRDVVAHERTGLLFKVADASDLAHALERLIQDVPLRARIAGEGRKLVHAEFSAERMARRYAELYERLITGASAQASRQSRAVG